MSHKPDHVRLFIPGPVEVRREILDAQAEWMIGHRSEAFAQLYARMQPKLKQAFFTQNRVYIFGSSGSGVWEAASRNAIRDEGRVLHLVAGAFSDRWAETSQANGKNVDLLEGEWGKAIKPEQLAEALKKNTYDAVACVYNETSTGVLHPVGDYAQVMQDYPDTLFLVDAVSGFAGAPIYFDEWHIDLCLTSTQKAFALPPGMAFAAVTDRVLARAETVKNRGLYFDLLQMEKYHVKDNTPSTPPVSLMFAADKQLDDMMAETMEGRFARHALMAEMTRTWAVSAGFELFSEEGYHSPTLTTVQNTHNLSVKALNAFLRERGMEVSSGYGKVKDTTIRLAHMGDTQPEHMQDLFAAIDAYLAQL